MAKTRFKIPLFTLWITVVCLALYLYLSKGFSITEAAEVLRDFIRQRGLWGPVLYVTVYSFRSLIFFPASILTILASILFGPWLGILFAMIGENISANISFVVGRYFAGDLLKYLGTKKQLVPRITCKIQDNGFLTVLIMRLTYLPFDLVGYSSGMCNIKHKDFALGTLIGTLPGLTTFVFLGRSVTDFRFLFFATAILAISLTVSVSLKKSFRLQKLLEKR
jgi:uncharacterized membrane protein YdjX (TVP38/TMEM64 family)